MNSELKINTCELLSRLEEKIYDLDLYYDEKMEKLQNTEDNNVNKELINDLNSTIYDILETKYFYKNIMKKLNKKQHYKCLSLAK